MPCDAHAIFYRGCGHIFLAQSQIAEVDTPAQENPLPDKASKPKAHSHKPPNNYPCSKYLPWTINISSTSCQECTVLPEGFELQTLGADPNDIAAFDTFSKQWLKQVEANVKLEGSLRDAALGTLENKAKGTEDEKSNAGKGKEVQKEKVKEDNLLDWEEAETEKYEGVGTQ